MKFQLWYRDEYGQGSILFTSEDLQKVIKEGKKHVNDINVENALTTDDKKRNWESYFVEIAPESFFKKQEKAESETGTKIVHYEDSVIKYIYEGKDGHGKDIVSNSKGVISQVDSDKINKCVIRFYLGKLNNKTWYASTPKNEIIKSFSDVNLKDKGVYFIKSI